MPRVQGQGRVLMATGTEMGARTRPASPIAAPGQVSCARACTRPPTHPRPRHPPAACSILHTLQVRYGLDAIYTYSGTILIAVSSAGGE